MAQEDREAYIAWLREASAALAGNDAHENIGQDAR